MVAGSFGNIFSRNSINNALMNLEVPKLIEKLRQTFSTASTNGSQQSMQEPSRNEESLDSPQPAATAIPEGEKQLTRRTGWRLIWNVKNSTVTIQEPEGQWVEKVGALPPNVQSILASGGLEGWTKNQIGAS